MSLQEKLNAKRFVITAEITPPVSAVARRIARQGAAAQRPRRRGQRHRRRRRAAASRRGDGGGDAGRARHRADPAAHLPRPQPHRLAERSARRRGVGRAQSAGAARRRSVGRRSARRQAGVRSRSAPVARHRAPSARRRRIAVGAQDHRRGRFFPRRRRQSDRSAARLEPNGLQAKIDAGAQFVQTQFCMDAGVVRRYLARLADLGIAGKLSM